MVEGILASCLPSNFRLRFVRPGCDRMISCRVLLSVVAGLALCTGKHVDGVSSSSALWQVIP